MVKSELIAEVGKNFEEGSIPTDELTASIIKLIIDHVSKGGRMEIRNFGTMEARRRAKRDNARNPRTGERVVTLEKFRPHFKPGQEMRRKVNNSIPVCETNKNAKQQIQEQELELETA